MCLTVIRAAALKNRSHQWQIPVCLQLYLLLYLFFPYHIYSYILYYLYVLFLRLLFVDFYEYFCLGRDLVGFSPEARTIYLTVVLVNEMNYSDVCHVHQVSFRVRYQLAGGTKTLSSCQASPCDVPTEKPGQHVTVYVVAVISGVTSDAVTATGSTSERYIMTWSSCFSPNGISCNTSGRTTRTRKEQRR